MLDQCSHSSNALVSSRFFLTIAVLVLILHVNYGAGAEQDRDKLVADRYWNILIKSPRRGTTFDRVYESYVDAGNGDLLLKQCEDLVAEQRDGHDAAKYRLLLGLIYQRRTEHEKAAKQFEQAAHLDTGNTLAPYYWAEQLLALSQPQEAIQALEESVRRNPARIDLREILSVLIQTALQTGDIEKALAACNHLKKLFDNDSDIVLQMAGLFAAEGHPEYALNLYRQAAEATPENPNMRWYFVEMLIQNGQVHKAIEEILATDPWINSDDLFESFLQREVRAWRRAGTLKQAIQILDSHVSVQEQGMLGMDFRSYWRLAAYFQTAGKTYRAIEALCKAMKSAEGSMATPPVRLLLVAAQIYQQGGDEHKAIEMYQHVVKTNGAWQMEGVKNLARLQFKTGQVEAGLKTGHTLMEIGAENAANVRHYAEMLLEANRVDEGINVLYRVLQMEPEDRETLRLLSGALSTCGRFDEATEIAWQRYERTENIREKCGIVSELVDHYHALGRIGDIFLRLRQQAILGQERELALVLARAYRLTGDFQNARKELQSFLGANLESENDVFLLEEFVETACRQEDYAVAIQYQEMICQITRLNADYDRLFVLYDLFGERDKAVRLFMHIILRPTSLTDRLESIDRMIGREEYEAVDRALTFLDIHEKSNWEVPYRRIALDVYRGRTGIDKRVCEFRCTNYPNSESNAVVSDLSGNQSWKGDVSQMEETVRDAVAQLPEGLQQVALRYSETELHRAWERLNVFLPTLFRTCSIRGGEAFEYRTGASKPFLKPGCRTEARFFVIAWLLKSDWDRDKEAYHKTVARFREELPLDSPDRDILLERIQLEWLQRKDFDNP